MSASARMSVESLVSKFSGSVNDAPTYVSACTAIDALVQAGQVTMADASAAKATLAGVMASAIASSSAKSGNSITVVARKLGESYTSQGKPRQCIGNVHICGIQGPRPLALYASQLEYLLSAEFTTAAKAALALPRDVKGGLVSGTNKKQRSEVWAKMGIEAPSND